MVLNSFENAAELLSIAVLFKNPDTKPDTLAHDTNLQCFDFFERAKLKEALISASISIVENTATGCKLSTPIESTDNAGDREAAKSETMPEVSVCHVHVRDDYLSGVVVAQTAYPHLLAHSLINKVLDDFSEMISREQWSVGNERTVSFQLQGYFTEYKHQKDGDMEGKPVAKTRIQNSILKAERDQDELIMEMHNQVEAALQRGHAINGLVDKSDMLISSKRFQRRAKRKSQCCVIL